MIIQKHHTCVVKFFKSNHAECQFELAPDQFELFPGTRPDKPLPTQPFELPVTAIPDGFVTAATTDAAPAPPTPAPLFAPNPGGGPRDVLFMGAAHNSEVVALGCGTLSDQLY